MANIFPPSDLLENVDGIGQGLRQNNRLRKWGWLGIFAGTAQFLGMAIDTEAWKFVSDPKKFGSLTENLPLVVSAFVFVLLAVTFVRFRGWIGESKEPFRYTCSIADFNVVPPPPADASFQVSPRLRYDLTERLNERIARLSFLDEKLVSAEGSTDDRSHIHIGGDVIVRQRPDEGWSVEVTPRIRMGGPTGPEKLAHSVKFTLGPTRKTGKKTQRENGRAVPNKPPQPLPLEAAEYEKILERVYFSIATQIYRQIRRDVEHKIALLPTKRLKAVAYLHEAEDYLRSNTLDAYDEARELFDVSLRLFVGKRRRLPGPTSQDSASYSRPSSRLTQLERGYSRLLARRARNNVLVARAEIGYAMTLVYRRALAGMAGQRVNSVFEARPVLDRALKRLDGISYRVPGAKRVLFDGYVTKALLSHYMSSAEETKTAIEFAKSVDPSRTDSDPSFLFAAGLMEIRPRQALPFLRRAVEEDPRFEVAQFDLALKTEFVWRMRPELETSVAEKIVAEEYMEVLKIDPGNVRAWTNLGYMYWLLDEHPRDAEDALLRGREYKEIKRTTYVAELDHSLARIYAEKGEFERAYKLYLSAVSAHIAQGVDHQSQTSAQFYFFDFIGPAMLNRFVTFKDRVVDWADKKIAANDPRETRRICDSVAAFAINDCGEAYRDYYSRMGDTQALGIARDLFKEARERNPQYVMPHFNLYLLESHLLVRAQTPVIERYTKEALKHLQRVISLEPRWPDAVLARVFTNLRAAERAQEGMRRLTCTEEQQQKKPTRFRRLVGQSSSTSTVGALPDEHRDKAKERELRSTVLEASDTAAQAKEIRRLTPHDWLWEDDKTFNWSALYGPPLWEGRWEREMDDLHVRALFSFGAGLYLKKVTANGDDDESKVPAVRDRQLHRLLLTIKDRFWPADFWLLRICSQIPESGVTEDQLKDIIRSWLREDPSAYWVLTLMLEETWTDVVNREMRPLFTDGEKVAYLSKASEQDGLPAHLYEWIAEGLVFLKDIERAILALDKAVSASSDPEVLAALGKRLEDLGDKQAALFAYRRSLAHAPMGHKGVLEQAVRGVVRVARGTKFDKDSVAARAIVDGAQWRGAAVHRLLELGVGEGVRATMRRWLQIERKLASDPDEFADRQAAEKDLELWVVPAEAASIDLPHDAEPKEGPPG